MTYSDPEYLTRQYRDAWRGMGAGTEARLVVSGRRFEFRIVNVRELASRGAIRITEDTGLFVARK
jgi:hypothetical protein